MTHPDLSTPRKRARLEESADVALQPADGQTQDADARTSSSAHVDELHRQLAAVNSLYKLYKVEHYAVFEELRLAHQQLKSQGHSAFKPSSDGDAQPLATAEAAPAHHSSMRSMLAAVRSEPGATAGTGEQLSVPQAAPAPATPGEAPADVSATPGTPVAQQQPKPSAQQDMSCSPPGVSLNVWAAPSHPACNNTPQSIRHAAVHASPAPSAATSQHAATDQANMDAANGHVQQANPSTANGDAQQGPSADGASDAPTVDLQAARSSDPGQTAPPRFDANVGPFGSRRTSAEHGDGVLGYGSDAEPGCYSDVEGHLVSSAAPAASEGVDQGRAAEWRARFASRVQQVHELEAQASALLQEELDTDGALACLSCRTGRFNIHRTTVLLGRGSDSKGAVDVDLTLATAAGVADHLEDAEAGVAAGGLAAAAKVSRRQAYLTLRPDGSWWLENVGRQLVLVDGVTLAQSEGVKLRHLALVSVGKVQLLFMVNQLAVDRVLRRTARMVV